MALESAKKDRISHEDKIIKSLKVVKENQNVIRLRKGKIHHVEEEVKRFEQESDHLRVKIGDLSIRMGRMDN